MNLAIQSPSDHMAISRMFGHVNPNTYSPMEYARTLAPVIENRLRTGPIGIANSQLDPHNNGVRLTLVCERTFLVRPQQGADANTVLHESGQPAQSDFNAFIGSLFESAEKLTDVTLVDAIGNTHTLKRSDIPSRKQSLAEDGPLDLSPLTEGGLSPFESAPHGGANPACRIAEAKITDDGMMWTFGVQGDTAAEASKLAKVRPTKAVPSVNAAQNRMVWFDVDEEDKETARKVLSRELGKAGFTVEALTEAAIRPRDIQDAIELLKHNGFDRPITAMHKGPNFWRIGASGRGDAEQAKADLMSDRIARQVEVFENGGVTFFVLINGPAQGNRWQVVGELSERSCVDDDDDTNENAATAAAMKRNHNIEQTVAGAFAKKGQQTESLAEDVAAFIGERADFIGAAERLLSDSEADPKQRNQEGLGYRAYLRQVITKKDPGYLTKSEDQEIKAGALRARQDVIDLAGTMQAESQEPLNEVMSLTPAYGRDYQSKAAVLADFNDNKDFIIADIMSRWDGKPANKSDLQAAGEKMVNIRYDNLRKVAVVKL